MCVFQKYPRQSRLQQLVANKFDSLKLKSTQFKFLCAQAVMKPEERSSLLDEKKKELEKHDKAIFGGIQEEIVYNKLRECLTENKAKNTVLINGWKDNGSKTRSQKEFDFLIVSQPSQTIIHIEVKKTCSDSQLKSATKQLENGLKMFLEAIPFPGSQKWRYLRVIYFAFAEREELEVKKSEEEGNPEFLAPKNVAKPFENNCLKCKNFIIGPKTDLSQWWIELTEFLPQGTKEKVQIQPVDTYLNVLSFLLHQMYKQQDCATTGQLVQLTSQTSDKICSPDTIIFWSKEQYKTFKDFKDTKVALTSGFGTGKTILIKAKAKELIDSKQNIIIVIFEKSDKKTILRMEYENLFTKDNEFVKITSISGVMGN
jgi:hypothetical protein